MLNQKQFNTTYNVCSHARKRKIGNRYCYWDRQKNKVVKTLAGSYPFDQLILGMGGEPNDFGTPGVKENGFTLWSFDDAVKIRHHIEANRC